MEDCYEANTREERVDLLCRDIYRDNHWPGKKTLKKLTFGCRIQSLWFKKAGGHVHRQYESERVCQGG